MNLIEITVPDIGDFKEVEIIEVLVHPGDTVAIEQTLLVLESDKATIDIPSSHSGIVNTLKVKAGDRVSKGSLVLLLETETTQTSPTPLASATSATTPAAATIAPLPVAAPAAGETTCDLLVIGAGPGGYSAAFRAADLGLSVILVERYGTLGGVCLNVGCIPSKALLHTTAALDETRALAAHGIDFGTPKIDLNKLRQFKEGVVNKLTGGLATMARARKVQVIRGNGTFLDAHRLTIAPTEGPGKNPSVATAQLIHFKQAIIAVGSQAVSLPFLPKDPRIVDATGALALPHIPKRMLVIGGGIIGLEMATVYGALGTHVDIVEMGDSLMQGADRDLVKVWEKHNRARFEHIMLKTRTVSAQATDSGIVVQFEGDAAPAQAQTYDLVLVAVGRKPNGPTIAAQQAGVTVNAQGFIPVDQQQRTNIPHIFAIGDVVGQPMLAHKAVHEAHVAAEVAAGQKSYFDAQQIPSVAYTDPEVAWTGLTEEQCKKQDRAYTKSVFPWAASGRAIANGRDEGMTKLLFDSSTHRIIGGGIVGTHAGDLIGEICLAIEMGADAIDIAKTIHPHPTLSESIGMAAEVFEGRCTDLPPQKK
ncbi:MAG: dihydrolipoyl dehydrogenase [Ottowia sp.]|nr:dihydrolipoyl dehydrogenase [Ottowia sp.]